MRAFNSCTKQESGGRLFQHWLTTVRDASLLVSWLSFSITPLTQLLNLFSNKKRNDVHRAWNLPHLHGRRRMTVAISSCLSLFNQGRIIPPKLCQAPSQDLFIFHRSELGHLLIPTPGRREITG